MPTSDACSDLSPLNDVGSPIHEAAATVLPGIVVDELREDAAVRAEDEQARTLGCAADLAADAPMAAKTRLACRELAHARFPTFRRTNSPS